MMEDNFFVKFLFMNQSFDECVDQIVNESNYFSLTEVD